MIIKKNNKFNQKHRLLTGVISSVFCMVSCTHNTSNLNEVNQAETAAASASNTASASPSISVNQIQSETQPFSTEQIQSVTTNVPQLTVEQLQNFVDRCLPNSVTPPPGVDCSEINLRVQNLLRADDKVIEALVTLGQLGRTESLSRTLGELNNGQVNGSIISGAIAGGLTNSGVPTTPEPSQTSPELTDFLQENGLSLNQGVISRLPQ